MTCVVWCVCVMGRCVCDYACVCDGTGCVCDYACVCVDMNVGA